MAFWLFMLAAVLLTPGVMIVFGGRFIKHPPDKINSTYGYRTAMSMKNRDTWIFAHRYCGKLWQRLGWTLGALSTAAMGFAWGRDIGSIGIFGGAIACVQCLVLLLSIAYVERALKKNFDKNGNKKGV